ncbi:unnamed protein product [Spodoptera littoralis]|uniref:Uncharacterized protein n=1 Tax=Spodoptera littoralis TaxID=7109 RepID=A0A9P0N2Y7_SPOLI|nr:unnamed protein product [Spodoptera littoralis]CAH1637971.1 unnamed protein product [Spodoptera littoralis]
MYQGFPLCHIQRPAHSVSGFYFRASGCKATDGYYGYANIALRSTRSTVMSASTCEYFQRQYSTVCPTLSLGALNEPYRVILRHNHELMVILNKRDFLRTGKSKDR